MSSDGFNFPLVNPQHQNMQRLLINAMGYLKPEHGLVDPVSGYPVEGWNHEPQRGLFLRSFTQLTAIGERLELLANIAAGFADNPYISRAESLSQLKLMLSSLLADQQDPKVSAGGLLGNFLGFDATGRIGPLSDEVERIKFVEVFGEEQATEIWAALVAQGWIIPQQDGSFAKISRKDEYGDRLFHRCAGTVRRQQHPREDYGATGHDGLCRLFSATTPILQRRRPRHSVRYCNLQFRMIQRQLICVTSWSGLLLGRKMATANCTTKNLARSTLAGMQRKTAIPDGKTVVATGLWGIWIIL